MLAEKSRGRLNLLCTFPGGHWIRANFHSGHRKVVCLFKQETSEGGRWPRGNEIGTLRRDTVNIASQTVTYIASQPQ